MPSTLTPIFCDSFAHYDSMSEMARKWTTVFSGNTVSRTGGRYGGPHLHMPVQIPCSKTFLVGAAYPPTVQGVGITQGRLVVGGGRQNGSGGLGGNIITFSLTIFLGPDEGTVSVPVVEYSHFGGLIQAKWSGWQYRTSDQTWHYRGNVSTPAFGGPGGETMLESNWYHVEAGISTQNNDVPFHSWFRVNGKTWFFSPSPIAPLNGGGSAPVVLRGQRVAYTGSIWNQRWSDVVMGSGGGDLDPDELAFGDQKVACIFPVADGAFQDWVPDSGTTRYSRVNEVDLDDASFIEASDPEDTSTFQMETLGGLKTIVGVQLSMSGSKTAPGQREVQPVIATGSSIVDDPDFENPLLATALGNDSNMLRKMYPKRPDLTAWTNAVVNDSEFGAKLTV